VVVATLRALKYHGGAALDAVSKPDLGALDRGLVNLERHVENVTQQFGLPAVVCLNRFTADTDDEIERVRSRMAQLSVPAVTSTHWADGGRGAEDLARAVVAACDTPSTLRFVYDDADPLWTKLEKLARTVYRASAVTAEASVRAQVDRLQQMGYGHYPICVAKTQYSFSTDPQLRAAPTGHTLDVREVRLAAGAEFVVMICGDVMTMPGLPKAPAACGMDIDAHGRITGLH
jgi:formate--tetrahydrofolate ligase